MINVLLNFSRSAMSTKRSKKMWGGNELAAFPGGNTPYFMMEHYFDFYFAITDEHKIKQKHKEMRKRRNGCCHSRWQHLSPARRPTAVLVAADGGTHQPSIGRVWGVERRGGNRTGFGGRMIHPVSLHHVLHRSIKKIEGKLNETMIR